MSWWFFLPAWVVCTIIVQFCHGAMTDVNVRKWGPEADYRHNPLAAIVGTAIAGAVYAGILTIIVSFVF